MAVAVPALRSSIRIASLGLLRPWVVVPFLGLILLPLLWQELAWLGISTHDLYASGIFYEVAFIGSLVGALVGMHQADEWGWIASRWRAGEVLRHEVVMMAVPLLGLVAVPLLWGLLGPWSARPLLGLATLLILVRPVALGLVLRRLPLPAPGRALAMLGLCWWIPAILAPSFPLGLGQVAHFAARGAEGGVLTTPGPWVAEISLLLALLLAARLGLGSTPQRS